MDTERLTLPVDAIQDRTVTDKIMRLFDTLRHQRGRAWALCDTMVVNVPGRPGQHHFRPIVRLVDTNTIELVSAPDGDENNTVRSLPRYSAPCWGFCGPHQEVDVTRLTALHNMDDSVCHFTPFSADIARWCEANYQDGKTTWHYTTEGRRYTIMVLVDNNPHKLDVFTQYSEDGTQQRKILRLDAGEAKRMVIESDILSGLPHNKAALVAPLFRIVGTEDKKQLPLMIGMYNELYNQRTYHSDRYHRIFEQEQALEEERGQLTAKQALDIMASFSRSTAEDVYPFTVPVYVVA